MCKGGGGWKLKKERKKEGILNSDAPGCAWLDGGDFMQEKGV